LQKDFNENSSFDKDEVTAEVLIETLRAAKVPKGKITSELVNAFREELRMNDIVSVTNVLTRNADNIKGIQFTNEVLKEHSEKIQEQFTKYMHKKGTKKISIKNGDNEAPENEQHSYVTEEDFQKILEKLTKKLTKRSMYRVQIDKDKFIKECTDDLNIFTKNHKETNDYIISSGQQKYDDVRKMKLEKGADLTLEVGLTQALGEKSEFEIVNHIMHHTMMPRLAILKIIRAFERKELLNSQDILDQVTNRINDNLQREKSKQFEESGYYEVIEGYHLESGKIFEIDNIIDEESLDQAKKSVYITSSAKRKAINKYYRMDSDGEYDFAQKLENNANVLLFTKLKKGGFVIDTPYGNYSPDWAVVYKVSETEVRLFFVVETKFDKKEEALSNIELTKIKCGIEHFKAVSPEVTFDWVEDYNDFKRKFGVVDNI